ncbi:MAG: Bug family tripartite tricarboxylate transporter substrate binding protein [bacterium]|jgi:tripartite-type tricarboxylate transporter receptor subunit TctC|nr:tripartite tricarboxylate transporter substrate binding protein [Betaproteobacteria bacterium]
MVRTSLSAALAAVPRVSVAACFAGSMMALALAVSPGCALAQSFPTKPIRVVVPFPPGAGPDQLARLLAAPMQEVLGQPLVVENRAGAQGTIAATEVARANPDGYTLLMGTNTTQAANVGLFKKLAYDPLKDFAYVARLAQSSLILAVRSDFPAASAKEFIAVARARKGELSGGFGSGGAQVSLGLLRSLGGIQFVEVPYKGIPIAVGEVVGGQIAFTFTDFTAGIGQWKAGRLKLLGVTSRNRSPLAPDLPALAEDLPGFEITIWWGMMAPAGTPREIVQRLSDAAIKALNRPEVQQRLAGLSVDPAAMGPDEFTKFVGVEVPRWVKQIREAGILPE